jgi:short subunit fatty acids transporter
MKMFFKSLCAFFMPNKIWHNFYLIMLISFVACLVLSLFVVILKDYLVLNLLGTAWSLIGFTMCDAIISEKGNKIE